MFYNLFLFRAPWLVYLVSLRRKQVKVTMLSSSRLFGLFSCVVGVVHCTVSVNGCLLRNHQVVKSSSLTPFFRISLYKIHVANAGSFFVIIFFLIILFDYLFLVIFFGSPFLVIFLLAHLFWIIFLIIFVGS